MKELVNHLTVPSVKLPFNLGVAHSKFFLKMVFRQKIIVLMVVKVIWPSKMSLTGRLPSKMPLRNNKIQLAI